MPTPTSPLTILLKAASAAQNETIYCQNLTKGGVVEKTLNSTKSASFNTRDESVATSWASGDTLLVFMRGKYKGSTTTTIASGGARVELSVAADTTSVNISL